MYGYRSASLNRERLTAGAGAVRRKSVWQAAILLGARRGLIAGGFRQRGQECPHGLRLAPALCGQGRGCPPETPSSQGRQARDGEIKQMVHRTLRDPLRDLGAASMSHLFISPSAASAWGTDGSFSVLSTPWATYAAPTQHVRTSCHRCRISPAFKPRRGSQHNPACHTLFAAYPIRTAAQASRSGSLIDIVRSSLSRDLPPAPVCDLLSAGTLGPVSPAGV